MITIFHNARCPYSREALSLVEKICAREALLLEIIDYPLSMTQLALLQQKLGRTGGDIVRSKDPKYKRLKLSLAKNVDILQAIVKHPNLLQRPIVVYQNRAVMARPAELVETLFEITEA